MSIMPFQSQGIPSSRELATAIAFKRMSQDSGAENMDKIVNVTVAEQSVVSISKANQESTFGTVQMLKDLKELGYDKDDSIVKDMLDADLKIRGVLVQVVETIPRLLR